MLKILCLVFAATLLCQGSAFTTHSQLQIRVCSQESTTKCQNWLGELWEEVIEFSTYGPSERRMLKEKREKAKEDARKKAGGDVSMDSFQRAQQKYATSNKSTTTEEPTNDINREESLSLGSFKAAVKSKTSSSDQDMEYNGYKLRDLLVDKFGVPLDVDFSRGNSGKTVYCSVLPVAFGSSRCRHATELDYLSHLQGVVEVLQKYDNLDPFLFFVQTTTKTPKPGVESVPYKMQLDEEQLRQIL